MRLNYDKRTFGRAPVTGGITVPQRIRDMAWEDLQREAIRLGGQDIVDQARADLLRPGCTPCARASAEARLRVWLATCTPPAT